MKKKVSSKSNKNKLLLPFAVIGISSLAVASANISFNKNNNELNSVKNQRSISDNSGQKNNLTNPNEVFYLSSKLDSTVDPWDSSTNKKNDANYKKWEAFHTNLGKVTGTSAIKDELLEIAKQVLGVVTLKELYSKLDDWAKDNPLFPSNAIQSAKDTLKQETGYKESITEVEGINTINEKLLLISGISEGTKISLNTTSIKLTDLSQTTQTQNSNGIGSVAGTNYEQLVKIAEIDPTTSGNYALSFKWKKSASSASVLGNLIIKNDASQLDTQKADLSKLLSTIDVFGRWSLGANGSIGTGSYNKDMENFIIQAKEDGGKTTIEVLVRLKNGESFSDLQWATDTLLPGATNLTKGSKFGILDVQADASKTFKSAILNQTGNGGPTSKQEYPTNGKLVDNIDSDAKLIKKVTFFSDSLSSKVATKDDTSQADGDKQSKKANRVMEFYQYEGVNLALPLYYALGTQSDASAKSYSYAPINIFTNGVDSKTQQTIILESTNGSATTLSPSTYNMFSELKDALPDEAKTDFQDASKIQLISKLHNTNDLVTQKLIFYDGFYAIGNRNEGWSSIDTNNEIKMIRISDPTSKIFAENPRSSSNDQITSTIVSGIKAQETINERNAVIGFLSNVYEEFSKPNSGEFEGERYGFTTGIWTSKGPNGSNINFDNINVNGSGNLVYKTLNDSWSKLSEIMNRLFPDLGANANRYKVTETNTSKIIVESYITFVSQFSVNVSELETEISKAISIVKEEVGEIVETTSYSSLTLETKKKLASIMVELIKIQFGTIGNELLLRLNSPLYNALTKVVDNLDNKTNSSINSPSSFLTSRNVANGPLGLIHYQQGGWNNVLNSNEVTIKDAVKSIFDLLYYKSSSNTYLGTAMYGASTPESSSDLLNLFESMDSSSLTFFESDVFSTQRDKLMIYNKLFKTFTNLDLQSYVTDMLRTGRAVSVDNLSNTIKTAIVETIQKISGRIKRQGISVSSEAVSTFYLDDLISGANAVISLKWKLNKIISENSNNVELKNKIIDILKTNDQINSYELSIWSNIIKGTYDYTAYSSEFSGRIGVTAVDEIALKLIQDESIMAPRSKDTIAAAVVLEKIVGYMWWIVVALIGAGVLVSSTVGIATKDRRIKLSSRPVLKWILISGIILGLGILGVALAIGIPPILI